jgi:vesicle-associated membrane protein 7
MTEQNYPKATVIGCLDSIQTEFKKKYSTYNFDSTPSYGLNQEFSSILKNKFIFYNNNKDVPDEQLNSLKEKLVVMKDKIIETNDLLKDRGDKINLIVKKAETLQDTSRSFYSSSKKVSLAARMKKIKIYLFIAGAIIILLIIGYFLFR